MKSKWGKSGKTRSVADNASAAAFLTWRIAQDALLDLEDEQYQTDSMSQRMDVIVEFVIFLAHIADRITYERMDVEERQEFVTVMVKHLARTHQASMEGIAGIKDYKEDFINLVNERMSDYADMPYEDGEPSFVMKRYLGTRVQAVMGEHYNKWIETQVLEINAPTAIKLLNKAIEDLYKPAF
ncbi:hypothetical protein [sulfur-oxidizing endosymbiont of Gigantopelta aegis]|uniref:hypothetical protein n=1 Tax=sulfur-oxidizing endosymbiont of Gigantopelta aegis TaxID=2794934 RepID=UPI0018DD0F59|nr:hypothetical protein [sulfur-oxidizing endosymbiont of Gigantopelta aegis]